MRTVNVVENLPERKSGKRRLSQVLCVTVGAILFAITVFLIFMAATMSLAALTSSLGDSILEEPGNPNTSRELYGAAALSAGLGIASWFMALRLLRGTRGLVLYLRRFGFVESTEAITRALAGGLGRRWRMLTLDDEHVDSLGLSQRTVTAATWGARWFGRPGSIIALLLACTFLLFAANAEYPSPGFLSELLAIMVALGFFIIAGWGAALAATVYLVLSVSSRSVRRAEGSRAVVIATRADSRRVLRRAVRMARRIYAPRLMVVRVHDELWRGVVTQLCGIADAVVVDISVPSANVLWELHQLQNCGVYWVPIGSIELLGGLQQRDDRHARELQELLGDRLVLGYDPKQVQPLSKGLRAALSMHHTSHEADHSDQSRQVRNNTAGTGQPLKYKGGLTTRNQHRDY